MSNIRLQVFISVIILTFLCSALPASNRQLHKRFNFNFMRTWDPIHHGAEPLLREYATKAEETPNETVESLNDVVIQQESIPLSVEQRIRSRFLCIQAMANPAACADI
ncbi:hypothetical protein M3Y96_00737000 [Aphelenchoides besseyi]|nr:hypothetical protein M3Y96_00737000 [Aphelenchoides besseyi]